MVWCYYHIDGVKLTSEVQFNLTCIAGQCERRRGTLSASFAVVNNEFNKIYENFTFRNQKCFSAVKIPYVKPKSFETTQTLKIKVKRSNKYAYVDYFDTCSQSTVDGTVLETYVEYTLCLTVYMHVIFRVFSVVICYWL